MNSNVKTVGFIMLRHVNSPNANHLWMHCYDCIRKFYPENHILIIDDNSKPEYILSKKLYKTFILNSEFPQRGEVLPYYYYIQSKLFDIAVIIHDSVFVNTYMDFSKIETYQTFWEFEHDWDNPDDEQRILNAFHDNTLNLTHLDKSLWKGCFGGMSVISFEYLKSINDVYDFRILLDLILNRYNRMSFERVLAILLQSQSKQTSLLGNIHKYCDYGIPFEKKDNYTHLPFIKVWSGR